MCVYKNNRTNRNVHPASPPDRPWSSRSSPDVFVFIESVASVILGYNVNQLYVCYVMV